MRVIASTDRYVIAVDDMKNRLLLTIKGDWMRPEDVPDFLRDFESGVNLCSPNFTTMADLREMGLQAVPDIQENAMKICVDGGVSKVAAIFGRESFAKLQLERAGGRAGLPARRVFTIEEAEAWLDQA